MYFNLANCFLELNEIQHFFYKKNIIFLKESDYQKCRKMSQNLYNLLYLSHDRQ
jgi:hypothetical protein